MWEIVFLLVVLPIAAPFYGGGHSRQFHSHFSTNFQSGIPNFSDEWYSFGDCQILMPEQKVPRSIIHFIGGFLAGSMAPFTYSELLTSLAKQGHMVVVTTIPPIQPDHYEIASNVAQSFIECHKSFLPGIIGAELPNVPIVGLSHSLGGKLMTLVNSNKKYRRLLPKRCGNIFLAFNNYDFNQSMQASNRVMKGSRGDIGDVLKSVGDIQNFVKDVSQSAKSIGDLFTDGSNHIKNIDARGLLDKLNVPSGVVSDDLLDVINQARDRVGGTVDAAAQAAATDLTQFKPTPKETWDIISQGYNIQRNVLFKFVDDEIDQSGELERVLRARGCDVVLLEVLGDHLTPNLMPVEPNSGSGQEGESGNRASGGPGRFARYLPMALNRLLAEYEEELLSSDIAREGRYLKG